MGAPRPAGQTIRGIGIGVPLDRQAARGKEVVLTLGLGWRDFPLRQLLSEKFDEPVFVENGRNLAAVGEWGIRAGRVDGKDVDAAGRPSARPRSPHSPTAGEVAPVLDKVRLVEFLAQQLPKWKVAPSKAESEHHFFPGCLTIEGNTDADATNFYQPDVDAD